MSAYDTGALEPARPQTPAIPDLDQRIRYAQHLAQAGLLPKAYRGQPANVLVAIDTGHMHGIAPMAALHNIHIVEGKPTLSAALMAALVRRAGHKIRVWSEGPNKAVAEIVRADDADFTYRAEWTTDRAREAGLLGKDVWKKYRPNMLKNRAISEVCRDGAQEIFLGPVYTPEELGAAVDAEGDAIAAYDVDAEMAELRAERAAEVVQQSAQRIDWESGLKSMEGDRDGLRKLWAVAVEYDESLLPDGFLERVMEAGKRAKAADEAHAEAAWAAASMSEPVPEGAIEEAVAELVDEPEECPGSGALFNEAGWTSIVKDDGSELALCQECDTWVWTNAGKANRHNVARGLPKGEVTA